MLSVVFKLHKYMWCGIQTSKSFVFFFFIKANCQTLQNLLSSRPLEENWKEMKAMGSSKCTIYLQTINYSLKRATGNMCTDKVTDYILY